MPSLSKEELKIRDEILQLIDEAIAMNQAPAPHPVAGAKRDAAPRKLSELFDEVEQGVESSLDEMKTSWPDASWSDEQTAAFFRLHDILLALRHWSNDVSSPEYSHVDALSGMENDESDFAPLKEHLRASFESMLSALSQLREHLAGTSQQSHDNIDQHMSDLQQPVHELRIFVNPLRTLIESRADVGRVATVRRRAAELDRMEKAGTLPDQLLDKIPKQYVTSVFDSAARDFMPRGALKQLIVAKAVMAQLKIEKPSEADRNLVDFIVSNARRVFAVAMQVLGKDELYPAMTIFMNNNFDDEELPVIRLSNTATSQPGSSSSIDEDAFLAPLRQMGEYIWTFGRRSNFDLNQWTFCAPVFSTTTINHDLHEKSILPFTDKKEIGAGTFGRVYRVKIQENHMDDSRNTLGAKPEYFAVKEILPPTEEERAGVAQGWELEARCLHQMNHRCPEHVLRFYTAFRRGQLIHPGHYLICEWADGGNLRDLWHKVQPKPLTASIVREAVQQLLGLALALHAAHYPPKGQTPIRHGDLKPENILWFKTGGTIGTLKIGDWGLAKEKSIATILQRDPTRTKYGSVRYQPPDVDTEHARSRLYDIWSLGCVMLEFVIWLVKGSAGLNRFHTDLVAGQFENKPFYASLGNGSHKVHDVVVAMMTSLANDPSCREGSALRDLLHLIREKLLVIALPPEGAERQESSAQKDRGGIETSQSQQQSTSMDTPGATAPESSPLPSPSKAEAVPRPVDVPMITLDAPTGPPAPPVSRPPRLLSGPLSVGPYRALAEVIVDELKAICDKESDNDSYWFSAPSSGDTAAKPAEVTRAAAADHPTSRSDVPSLTFSVPTEKTADSDGSRLFSSGPSIYVDSGMIPISSAGSSRNFASDPSQASDALEQGGLLAPEKKQILDDAWSFYVDNQLAQSVFSAIHTSKLTGFPHPRDTTLLCDDCRNLEPWKVGFRFQFAVSDLKEKAAACDLCGLFWRTYMKRRDAGSSSTTVAFSKEVSWLKMDADDHPALFLCRDPASSTPAELQMGFPNLPDSGSPAHLEIIRQWLRSCDELHHHPPTAGHVTALGPSGEFEHRTLPTRLIDVGRPDDKIVRLWETSSGRGPSERRYAALSHPWGESPHFCTDRRNLATHIHQGIEFDRLPATFADAVRVTRGLGLRYLWIDSLCILQGADGDFAEESQHMEQVFSGAYCVLAASCAEGQWDGFLERGREKKNEGASWRSREYVALSRRPPGSDQRHGRQSTSETIYVCEAIDDFNSDVLGSPLNSRGWVLQEHALARRTVFFTSRQTYFQCGRGVRCETLMRMENNLAALLGDTNFPQIMMSASQGERILRYQDLYRKYTRRRLTHRTDRPVAIAGLESRLLGAFSTKGGFGVFDGDDPGFGDAGSGRRLGHLRRSLLWHRAEAESPALVPIDFSDGNDNDGALPRPPSWSWMALTGPVDYLPLDFNGVEWEQRVCWSLEGALPEWTVEAHQDLVGDVAAMSLRGATIVGEARRLLSSDWGEDGRVIFDRPDDGNEGPAHEVLCVVLGRRLETGPSANARRHYLLFVEPIPSAGSAAVVVGRRVGVGYLPSRCISHDTRVVLVI